MDDQAVARLYARGFGGNPQVLKFMSTVGDDEKIEAGIAVVDGSPAAGFVSLGTVGVRGFPSNVAAADGRRIVAELVLAARKADRALVDVLAAAAFAVGAGSFHLTPFALIPGAVSREYADATCEHLFLVPPFIWPHLDIVTEESDVPLTVDGEGETPRGDLITTILQAVPVTPAESVLAAKEGGQALFDRLDAAAPDITDLRRASVV